MYRIEQPILRRNFAVEKSVGFQDLSWKKSTTDIVALQML